MIRILIMITVIMITIIITIMRITIRSRRTAPSSPGAWGIMAATAAPSGSSSAPACGASTPLGTRSPR